MPMKESREQGVKAGGIEVLIGVAGEGLSDVALVNKDLSEMKGASHRDVGRKSFSDSQCKGPEAGIYPYVSGTVK